MLYNFVSGPEFPAELERVSKITDGVLRSMVIRKEEKSSKNAKAPVKEDVKEAAAETAAE